MGDRGEKPTGLRDQQDNRRVSYDVQGELPKPPKEAQAPKIPPYIRLVPEAIRLRDEGLTFREIGERPGRAWGHRGAVMRRTVTKHWEIFRYSRSRGIFVRVLEAVSKPLCIRPCQLAATRCDEMF